LLHNCWAVIDIIIDIFVGANKNIKINKQLNWLNLNCNVDILILNTKQNTYMSK